MTELYKDGGELSPAMIATVALNPISNDVLKIIIMEIKGLLRLGGNESVVEAGDIVLDPPSTPLTNKPGVPATIPNILNLGSDVLVLNGDGGFILVDNG